MKKLNNIVKTFSIALLLFMSMTVKAQTQSLIRAVAAENRVAILPMTYIGEGSDNKMEQMRYSLQNIAHRYLQEEAIELRFQDPAETNALLLKNGIDESNFREFTPKELAAILKVEYVLIGIVSQEVEGILTVSNTSNSYSYNRRGNHHNRGHHHRGGYHHNRGRHEKNSSVHIRTRQDVNTTVDLVIYNDKGEEIFSRSRRSLLSNMDTYKAGLQYLLKRTPLYKK